MLQRKFRFVPILLGLAACGGGDGGSEPTHVLEVVKWTPSGDHQTDTVTQTLPNVIRVKVTLDGEVTAGVTVNFSGGVLGTPSMVTGSNGIATSTWTLGSEAGVQSVTATVAGAVGSPLTFTATALAGPATQMLKLGGDLTVVDTGMTFLPPFTVKVSDQYGNGIPGQWVHWSGTGPVVLSADSIRTDSTGQSAIFAVGGTTDGAVTVTADVAGLSGAPMVFNAAVAHSPFVININSNFFDSDSLVVPAGSAVKWLWVGSGHSVSSTGENSFASSEVRNAGAVWGPLLFLTPGVYTYECSIHPTMQGKIVVN